jgi:hypothetical protein
VSLLTRFLNVQRSHCGGIGYTIVDGGPDCDGAQFRRDCRGCHDCKPSEYTKGHYKRRTPKSTAPSAEVK